MFKILVFILSLIVLLSLANGQVQLSRSNLAQILGFTPGPNTNLLFDLSNKSIVSIDPNTFVNLTVNYLKLNNNKLTSISAATLNAMPMLLELYLHNNQLTSFDPLSLKGMKDLKIHNIVQ